MGFSMSRWTPASRSEAAASKWAEVGTQTEAASILVAERH